MVGHTAARSAFWIARVCLSPVERAPLKEGALVSGLFLRSLGSLDLKTLGPRCCESCCLVDTVYWSVSRLVCHFWQSSFVAFNIKCFNLNTGKITKNPTQIRDETTNQTKPNDQAANEFVSRSYLAQFRELQPWTNHEVIIMRLTVKAESFFN